MRSLTLMPRASFNAYKARSDFPLLSREVHGKPLVYLDNAASTQKPKLVLDRIQEFYEREYSNVHRGIHYLSQVATTHFEDTRGTVQRFIHAESPQQIIFVRGATEGINLVAYSYGRKFIGLGDEIILSALEHHSNIVPWQILCETVGAKLKIIPINDRGELLLNEYKKLITEKTKLVAITHVSNALGTVVPVKEMIQLAHEVKAKVLVDGAQAAPHLRIDVQDLDCDFYVFSSHKLFGPTGVGVLYGKKELLEAMPPFQGGGDMIQSVSFEKTTYKELPYKFEAGTPAIEATIGLGAAIEYLNQYSLEEIESYEQELLSYATRRLQEIPQVRIVGTAAKKVPVLSFTIQAIHPHDIGTILDQEGVAIRAGHHCAQPLMELLDIPATARASLAFYNTHEDVDALVCGIQTSIDLLG